MVSHFIKISVSIFRINFFFILICWSVASRASDNLENIPPSIFPEINNSQIPFSYNDSFFTLNKQVLNGRVRVKLGTTSKQSISHKWQDSWAHDLFEITLYKDGQELEFDFVAYPWSIEIAGVGFSATIAFKDGNTIAIQPRNCQIYAIPCHPVDWKFKSIPNDYLTYDIRSLYYYRLITQEANQISIVSEKNLLNENAYGTEQTAFTVAENKLLYLNVEREEYQTIPSFDLIEKIVDERKEEVNNWMQKKPKCEPQYENASNVAWYLFWNMQMPKSGNYTRKAISSSKRTLVGVWSWDNLFNAITVVNADNELAWDQLNIIMDKQLKSGLIPDAISDLSSMYGYNKPPVWGLAIPVLLEKTPKDQWNKHISEVYEPLIKFTEWWYIYRDSDHNNICEYAHGNDSGWDNCTVFDGKVNVESPDLTAYLITQWQTLAVMARYLGKTEDALKFEKNAKDQTALFNTHFNDNGKLIYYDLKNDEKVKQTSTSLLTRLPLVLADNLAPNIKKQLIKDLKEENVFLCPAGIASEALTSPKYEPNGYWRGPVWGPSTYIAFLGLLKVGEKALAATIARRYCDALASEVAFRENFNAKTGKGQYDTGMTWSAAEFLILSEWLAEYQQ